jgi:hypothetical protein
MNKTQDERLLDAGQVITVDGQDFEVITVSAQELDGKLVNFRYELALKSEIDALREQNKAEQAAVEAAARAAAEAETSSPDEPETLLPK